MRSVSLSILTNPDDNPLSTRRSPRPSGEGLGVRVERRNTVTQCSIVARYALVVMLLSLSVGNGVASANSSGLPFIRAGLVQVDVYDRADGSALPVHLKDGRHYIVGTPGHEYAVRIRNCTGARVLVVTSVDGVNVISGDTAAPSQSGYVLDPWGSVEIAGWRKNLQRTAAFFFTEHQNSYAARTGRPDNVGVIGVAVFREKAQRISQRERDLRLGQGAAENEAQAGAAAGRLESHANTPAAVPSERASADELSRQDASDAAAKTLGKLGTGHGRSETSRASVVRFERASESPAETISLQYDRRENLVAMGVLPAPAPQYARRDPNPFPGAVRFAPDPLGK